MFDTTERPIFDERKYSRAMQMQITDLSIPVLISYLNNMHSIFGSQNSDRKHVRMSGHNFKELHVRTKQHPSSTNKKQGGELVTTNENPKQTNGSTTLRMKQNRLKDRA
jgi:hypothetical protein